MTSTFPDISISTERLVLRPLDTDDVPALAAMMNDEQVTAWTDAPHPFTEDSARTWITREAPALRASGRGLVLAVTEFLTQRLVGVIRLGGTDWQVRSTELSYIVAPWARGEGYASEAALATAQWLFGDQRLQRVELRTAADNTAAQQVAQKIGCISEGVLRGACIARARTEDGGWSHVRTDYIVWSLLPEDVEGADGQLADSTGFSSYPDWN
ncbi:GNAT family N-acetyltransferase [Streptomyces pilosus]|uniref:N-acetyltransferase n=1 Tax=Streptomyces pilosus TaxID=28893 RepID=A0A918F0J1_9ACTN|nr:GNAT family N-acetyltransferase [Streptomyces pilosus]GGQ96725.1 N-acetyltransferase [Streptomyces pilosus]GGV61526.1 N-acetyltransferase [Streptomyces pilosus]